MTWCSQCASLSVESLYLQGRDLCAKAGAFIIIIVVVVVVVVVDIIIVIILIILIIFNRLSVCVLGCDIVHYCCCCHNITIIIICSCP